VAGGRFSLKSITILKDALQDDGLSYLKPGRDLPMLLAFLERFDQLGWLPPVDPEKQRILAAHDVTMHTISDRLCFYEFCSKGGRGERDPWLSVFFHVAANAKIRICGLERTLDVQRRRRSIMHNIHARVERLDKWLTRHREL